MIIPTGLWDFDVDVDMYYTAIAPHSRTITLLRDDCIRNARNCIVDNSLFIPLPGLSLVEPMIFTVSVWISSGCPRVVSIYYTRFARDCWYPSEHEGLRGIILYIPANA